MAKRPETSTIDSLTEPVRKRSVVSIVIDRLTEAMINRELRPGDFLPSETELTRRLGVGKTSVREAIKMLEAMGVVEIRQGHGTYIPLQQDAESISPLTFQLILEQATNEQLVELRQIFEPAYSLVAMRKATDQDIAKIEQALLEFERKIAEGTQTADDDLLFHLRILESTHNPFVVRIGNTIHQLFKASVGKSMKKIPDTALRDHKAIFKAFVARDARALQAAIFESFKGWELSLEINE